VSQQKVTSLLGHPLAVTSVLVAYAAVLIVVAGVGLGLLSALRPGPVDALISVGVSVATAIPPSSPPASPSPSSRSPSLNEVSAAT
jgi:ABC-type dipeptide/oligopeptide/nickel transport system permease component